MPLDHTYAAFVAAAPAATVWHDAAVLEAVCSADQRVSADYVAVREAGALVGVLPFCRKARLDGWTVMMPPLLRYCGPVFDAAWLREVGAAAALERLWAVLPRGYRSFDQSWGPGAFPPEVVRAAGWRGGVRERRTHRIDLSAGEDAATAGRSKRMRKDLRRAGERLTSDFSVHVDAEVHDVLEAPYRRQNMPTPYSRAVVDALFRELGPRGRICCARLRDGGGDLKAAAVYLADGHTGYAFLAGAEAEARKYSGGNYAVALGPEWAAGRGLGGFDFLGSDMVGIADTLRRMGGVATGYGHLSHDAAAWARAVRWWRGR